MNTLRNLLVTLFATATFSAALAQTEPQVTTDTRFARGATMAFGRATFKAATGNAIMKSGFCYSDVNKEPTILDNVSTKKLSNNGIIFCMTDLKPATIYYARAYAEGKDGAVGYGNVIKIVTLPKGTVGGDYDNGADAAANERIQAALDKCKEYWNNLTSIQGLWLSVHYGAQTPTADCSYGGWMRVGPGQQYQYIGTMMHEALHAIGVGQHDMWYGSNSPLRGGSGTGKWLGDRVTELFRFWDNKDTHFATGDGTHVWCSDEAGAAVTYDYAANNIGAYDRNSEMQIIGTSLLAQALGEDGLPPVSPGNDRSAGSATPYYAFDQEDDVKYYIKNESETYGLMTSYLVETADHKLQWKQMTVEAATADDAAAWYVSFTPENQYYQFRNAKTGFYITYKGTGSNGIVTEQHSAPTGNDNFQLMRSRCDVKNSAGAVVTNERGYWILHPENGTLNPPALVAAAGGATTVAARNFTDKATSYRWLILTAKQVNDLSNSSLRASRESYYKARSIAASFLATPHFELMEGADATLLAAFAEYDAACEAAESAAEVNAATTAVTTAGKAFLKSACVKDVEHPFNLTAMMKNPDFADGLDGWTYGSGVTGSWSNQAVEFYQKKVNVYQALVTMPTGTYEARVQAFQRPGGYTDVYNNYVAGTDNVDAKLYLQSSTYGEKICNIMVDRAATSQHTGDKRMSDGTYIPDNMASAAAHFQAGYYDNKVQRYFKADDTRVQVGIYSSANGGSSYWTIYTNFRLYYYGPLEMQDILAKIEASQTLTGDADGDGMVTMADANMVVNVYLGMEVEGFQREAADMDGDGEITMADANAIVNLYLGAE